MTSLWSKPLFLQSVHPFCPSLEHDIPTIDLSEYTYFILHSLYTIFHWGQKFVSDSQALTLNYASPSIKNIEDAG